MGKTIRGKIRSQDVREIIRNNKGRLETLKEEVGMQEIEYLAKEKQITTFLECKKSFFGKFKYYFKYSKKKNKEEIQPEMQLEEEKENAIPEKNEIIRKRKKREIIDKENYTIEELIDIYKEYEKLEYILKNIMLDINSLKLKKKNMAKKIENATLFIEEIDSHKKSIFEFWRYSNKDAIEALPEGEEEEVNIIRKITKVFDYEEDLEKFGRMMDRAQRKVLSKQETDSIYIASTSLITIFFIYIN